MALSTFGHFKAHRPSIPEMGNQSTCGFMRRGKPWTQPFLCGVPKSCKYVGEQLPVRRAFRMKRVTRLRYGVCRLAALGRRDPVSVPWYSEGMDPSRLRSLPYVS